MNHRRPLSTGPRQLGIFARFWQPGQVKTRLAAGLGDSAAAALYRSFVQTLVERFGNMPGRRVLAVTPDDRAGEFGGVAGSQWQVEPQGPGELASRMRRYFEKAFAAGMREVVLIGSDSPTLPRRHVELAFELLNEHEVVLGPSADGGYYLVGAACRVPPIFDGVAMSTPAVWQQTVDRLNAAACSFGRLPEWYDIDTLDDLRRLRAELGQMQDESAELCGLAQAVDEAWQGQKAEGRRQKAEG
jgi:hypothetical protein